jgi:DNA-binding transcriptional ArsR family regulator
LGAYLTIWLFNFLVHMQPDPLSMKFAALADPTRRANLARLALGQTSVSELAEPFEMSLPAISKHLKVLERAGLIIRGREAQWRPCRIEPHALKEVDDWLERYRRFWSEQLDRLAAFLEEDSCQSSPAPPSSQASRSSAASTRRRKKSTRRGPTRAK